MVFVEYKFGAFKKQIRDLLRKRGDLKKKIIYHQNKIDLHLQKIDTIQGETLISVDKELNKYLAMAGNKV